MALLPASVVAELELNSVIPPPDTIEEEAILIANPYHSILHHINSTQSVVVIAKDHKTLGTFARETDYKA